MSKSTERIVNKLPSKTWYWLNINDAKFKWDQDSDLRLEDINLRAPSGQVADPVKLHICGENNYNTKHITIDAEENSKITVYMTFETENHLAVITEMSAAKNAEIKLVQIQLSSKGSLIFNKVSGEIDESAKIEVVQFYMGQGNIYTDNLMNLNGYKSQAFYDIAYLGQNKDIIDINIVLNHYGARSNSETNVSGALKDASYKTFRGTIDFKNGSSRATGAEQETVLLLGNDVHNRTLPVILCAEEDVSGNHGATIGELDEETLFYFRSRGIDKTTAENIMARAGIQRQIRKVEDEEMYALINERLDRVIGENNE